MQVFFHKYLSTVIHSYPQLFLHKAYIPVSQIVVMCLKYQRNVDKTLKKI